MAADGGHGPKPFQQHRASTTFLRVPAADWPLIARGAKTEFRGARGASSQLWSVEPPTPVVAYAIMRGVHEGHLMLLEEVRREPLGAISDESLRREGFSSFAEFRRYWMHREKRRFQPTREVFVYRVRPWLPSDRTKMATMLFDRLYGDWVDV
jgi:hypothetical protein